MKNFNQDRGRSFSDRGFNRRSRGGGFGGRNRSSVSTMHKTVCSECGKDCEVPFKPTGSKPVFCSICFGDKRSSGKRSEGSERRFERGDSFKSRFDSNKFSDNKKIMDNPKMDEVISRLDKIIELLVSVIDLKKEESQPIKTKERSFLKTKKDVIKSPIKAKTNSSKRLKKAIKPR